MSLRQDIIRNPGLTKICITLFDSCLGGAAMYGAMQWRYDFENKPIPDNIDNTAALIFGLSCLMVWIFTRVNRAIWNYISLGDIRRLLQAVILCSLITPVILFLFFDRANNFPRSVPFICAAVFFGALILSRLIYQIFKSGDLRALFIRRKSHLPNSILVGNGQSLHNYIRDMNRKTGGIGFNILGLIDTDKSHKGLSIQGYPILGGLAELESVYRATNHGPNNHGQRQPVTLIATDPHIDRTHSYDLIRFASDIGAPLVRINPGPHDGLTPFEAADLIGRPMRPIDMANVRDMIDAKRVMITGAGGSIGSELAWQVASFNPERLILIDNSEFNLYKLKQSLLAVFPEGQHPNWQRYLADICDKTHMHEIFMRERPDLILHAAAYKHVPLGEENPLETLKVNVEGTHNLLELAKKFKLTSFTLVSTDKAVNPKNIMGASKSLAEKLTLNTQSDKANSISCLAVRFGNVLTSSGSVIPLFEDQIAKGGPVTVTHKDVNRYFMSTEEAAILVLQATVLHQERSRDQGSIYVLEMGEPVNITHLARQLIRLRGLVPDRDIKIEFTGLRSGEKISEILNTESEDLSPTSVDSIHAFTGKTHLGTKDKTALNRLVKGLGLRQKDHILASFKQLLPDFNIETYFTKDS